MKANIEATVGKMPVASGWGARVGRSDFVAVQRTTLRLRHSARKAALAKLEADQDENSDAACAGCGASHTFLESHVGHGKECTALLALAREEAAARRAEASLVLHLPAEGFTADEVDGAIECLRRLATLLSESTQLWK